MSLSLLYGSGVNETDEVLIRRGQKGDRIAFEELVRRTARLVFSPHYLEIGNTHRPVGDCVVDDREAGPAITVER